MLCHDLLYTLYIFVFFFSHPPTTESYPLSLHDALPISARAGGDAARRGTGEEHVEVVPAGGRAAERDAGREPRDVGERLLDLRQDRKSTRLNSSHVSISYAVFCLKKKKKITKTCCS